MLYLLAFHLHTQMQSNTRTVEAVGYAARAKASSATNKLMPYVIQQVFILLPPALFAATIYMTLSRIIRLVGGEHLSIISPRWLTRVFVGGDVLSFVIQGNSASMTILAESHPALASVGNWMVIGGLAIQLCSFTLFWITALVFHARMRKVPTARSFQVDQSWVDVLYMLYTVSALIIVRSIFRVVDYVMDFSGGYLLTHEWSLYVFDCVPMLIVVAVFFRTYPDQVVMKETSEEIRLESQMSGEGFMSK